MARIVILVAVLVAVMIPSTWAIEGESWGLSAAKEDFGFDAWPGKTGNLKQGFRFQLADYPMLAGGKIESDYYRVDEARGAFRDLEVSVGDKHLEITIGVSFESAAKAQEMLAMSSLPGTTMVLTLFWSRGDQKGFLLGDINLFNEFEGITSVLTFARNNVFCCLDSRDGFDVKLLAQAMDAKIKAMPDVTLAQFNATKPQIITFAPKTPIMNKRTDGKLTVVVYDPTHTSIKRNYSATSESSIEDKGNTTMLLAGWPTGKHILTMYAFNGFLQFSKAQSSVQVTERDD